MGHELHQLERGVTVDTLFDDSGAELSLVRNAFAHFGLNFSLRNAENARDQAIDACLTAFGQVAGDDSGGELRGVLHKRLAVTVEDEATCGW